ncbi:hypothetical protein AAG906_030261 [Vitis piasezkii]
MEHVTESTVEGIRRLSCHTPTLDAIPAVATLRRWPFVCFMAPRRARGASRHWASAARASRTAVGGSRRGSTRAFSLDRGIPGTSNISSRKSHYLSPFSDISRAFYSRMTFGHAGPITSTVRGVDPWTRRASAAFWTFLWWTPVYDAKAGGDVGFRSESRDSEAVRPCRCPGVGQTIGP